MHHGRARPFAAGVALVLSLVVVDAAQPRGVTLPAEVRAACDAAYTMAARTPGAKARRQTGTYQDEVFRGPIVGCRIDIAGSFAKSKGTAAPEKLRSDFEAQGWTEIPEFSSDGHDGTSFAYRKSAVACYARGSWDGGADDQPEIPAGDPYEMFVICGRAPQFERPQER